ncbi:MAG TPA: M23 family metallopeptidase, partial [Candidatus Lustribacter sp.]|nr:M23 family metallopeptidase [Candidatus Lustribacter sp.]
MSPRLVSVGLLLPTSAAAAIVLTGSASPAHTQTHLALSSAELAQGAASSGASARASAALADRVADLRAARDSEREAWRIARAVRTKASAAANKAREFALTRTDAGAPGSHLWVNPFSNYSYSSPFGFRWGRLHAGIDLAGPVGTRVRAMSSGTVVFAGDRGGYGTNVEIKYWDGSVSWYAHLSSVEVTIGDTVNAGEIVARSGNTGHSTGPHLHLESIPAAARPRSTPCPG